MTLGKPNSTGKGVLIGRTTDSEQPRKALSFPPPDLSLPSPTETLGRGIEGGTGKRDLPQGLSLGIVLHLLQTVGSYHSSPAQKASLYPLAGDSLLPSRSTDSLFWGSSFHSLQPALAGTSRRSR